MIPVDTINTLEQTWRSMTEFCETLTETEWKTASQLPNWSVQDNLSHIIGTESSMQGIPRPDHTAPDKSHVKNPIGDVNEDDVDVRRARSGAEVLAEWKSVMEQRLATLRTRRTSHKNLSLRQDQERSQISCTFAFWIVGHTNKTCVVR
jgi:uncharacterized protein (TIGR03083 family)